MGRFTLSIVRSRYESNVEGVGMPHKDNGVEWSVDGKQEGKNPGLRKGLLINISESHGNGGKMGRVSYELSEENRRRLELLTAFGILNGHYPSRDEIVNESIRQYFRGCTRNTATRRIRTT